MPIKRLQFTETSHFGDLYRHFRRGHSGHCATL